MKLITFLLIVSVAFISACTGTRLVRTTITEQHDFNVTLEQHQEKGIIVSQKYAHPYVIDISDLEKLMGDLKYTEKSGLMRSEKQSSVFQAVEIDRLAPVLTDALAKADTSQRIRFTSFNQGDFLIFSVARKTEGVIFIEPAGRLNIAFNYINSNRQSGETTAVDPIYSSVDPLKIKVSEITISATAPYAELHKFETGKQAPMWVVADIEKLKETSTATVPVVNTAEETAPAVAPKAGIKDTPVENKAPNQASEDLLKEDIKIKLKYLKELLDEGLISEKDYTAKKKELLDKIE
jgi:hypothetical protein